jgi:hypothetical protein
MEFRRVSVCFCIVIFQCVLVGNHLLAQNTPADSAQVKGQNSAVFSIDVLSSVIYSGRNYGVEQMGFNPSIVFYHKSGFILNMYSYGMEKTDGLITETDLGLAYKLQIHPKMTLTPGYAYLFNRVQDKKVLFNVFNLGSGLNLKLFSINNYLGFSFGGGRTSWYEEFSVAKYISLLYRVKGSIAVSPTFVSILGTKYSVTFINYIDPETSTQVESSRFLPLCVSFQLPFTFTLRSFSLKLSPHYDIPLNIDNPLELSLPGNPFFITGNISYTLTNKGKNR